MNRILAYAVALLVVLGLALTAFIMTGGLSGGKTSSRSIVIKGAPQIGGEFTLVNNKGQSVTDKDFQGKMMLIFFGYTFCPDVCPTEMQTFSQVIDELGADANDVIPVFITIDPARDTVAVMDEFVAAFHPSIIGLTGSEEQINHVKKQYRAYGQKVEGEDRDFYLVDHTSFTYLMDREGVLASVFSYGTTPKDIVTKIKEFL